MKLVCPINITFSNPVRRLTNLNSHPFLEHCRKYAHLRPALLERMPAMDAPGGAAHDDADNDALSDVSPDHKPDHVNNVSTGLLWPQLRMDAIYTNILILIK